MLGFSHKFASHCKEIISFFLSQACTKVHFMASVNSHRCFVGLSACLEVGRKKTSLCAPGAQRILDYSVTNYRCMKKNSHRAAVKSWQQPWQNYIPGLQLREQQQPQQQRQSTTAIEPDEG